MIEEGDTVAFNDTGLRTAFGAHAGALIHMKTLHMQVTRIWPITASGPRGIAVDRPEFLMYSLYEDMFDVVAKPQSHLLHKAYLEYVGICKALSREPIDERTWSSMTETGRTLFVQSLLGDLAESKAQMVKPETAAALGTW